MPRTADCHAVTDPDAHSNAYADTDSITDANPHADAGSDAHTNTLTNSNADTCSHGDADAHDILGLSVSFG